MANEPRPRRVIANASTRYTPGSRNANGVSRKRTAPSSKDEAVYAKRPESLPKTSSQSHRKFEVRSSGGWYHRAMQYTRPGMVTMGPRLPPAVKYIILACVGIYFLASLGAGREMIYFFGLTPHSVFTKLFIWQPLTYIFFHGGFWHVFMNMFAPLLDHFVVQANIRRREVRCAA